MVRFTNYCIRYYTYIFFCLGYVLDGLPCKCDDWVSIDEQLAFVQDLRVKPDFVINLRVSRANARTATHPSY